MSFVFFVVLRSVLEVGESSCSEVSLSSPNSLEACFQMGS